MSRGGVGSHCFKCGHLGAYTLQFLVTCVEVDKPQKGGDEGASVGQQGQKLMGTLGMGILGSAAQFQGLLSSLSPSVTRVINSPGWCDLQVGATLSRSDQVLQKHLTLGC